MARKNGKKACLKKKGNKWGPPLVVMGIGRPHPTSRGEKKSINCPHTFTAQGGGMGFIFSIMGVAPVANITAGDSKTLTSRGKGGKSNGSNLPR